MDEILLKWRCAHELNRDRPVEEANDHSEMPQTRPAGICMNWGYIYEVQQDTFTDPPSGHLQRKLRSAGTIGSRVIGVRLSFRPEGGFEGTGFEPRCSRQSPRLSPIPSPPRRSKNSPGFFVTTNLPRGLGGELFAPEPFFLVALRRA